MVQSTRIKKLNTLRSRAAGSFVLYWMQEAQRSRGNPALELAIQTANENGLPILVCFALTDCYPESNARHYAFMLDGLADVAKNLAARGVVFIVRHGQPVDVALDISQDATVVFCDRSYLPLQIGWRNRLAQEAGCSVIQVETEVVVPVDVTSDKSEYAARTIRPKIHRVLDQYLLPLEETQPKISADNISLGSDFDIFNPDATLSALDIDWSVAPVKRFKGGENEAHKRLNHFLNNILEDYAEGRNEPSAAQTSFLSPYLHFGHISPVQLGLAVRGTEIGTPGDRDSFIEELIIRRELAINYVTFQPNFGIYGSLPVWARKTLEEHAGDKREYLYSIVELEACETHDPHWNDAMREMIHTGFMQNYMRMYWAKKILEWSPTPQQAFETTLNLNNKYFLDGRDPNSYANVAWCYGLHDRAWTERPVFGKIRYMNARGLNRKFDMAAYTSFVDRLVASEKNYVQRD
ncbi:MAG: hypothetical protein CFH41_01746 [Alphaproteobacteria bacterium MarineAlpha11_Bin1]|nr:MAG: hypothetical protein CFH41_01746 [Alphaproteobacteria bacterium MarineAlpha11_Bin1]